MGIYGNNNNNNNNGKIAEISVSLASLILSLEHKDEF
jgi:hypothetical protein